MTSSTLVRPSLILGTVAATAAGLIVSAPAPAHAAAKRLPVRAYVVGDSLTVGCSSALRSNLSRRIKSVTVDGRISRHTSEGISLLRSSAARRADIWVVALGTNDAPSTTQTRSNVRKVLRMAGDRQVVWMTVVRPGGYDRVNRELLRLDRKYKRLTVVDWAKTVQRKRWVLAGDSVHLTASGYRLRAEQLARHINELSKVTVARRKAEKIATKGADLELDLGMRL